jgi:hypothetical protein
MKTFNERKIVGSLVLAISAMLTSCSSERADNHAATLSPASSSVQSGNSSEFKNSSETQAGANGGDTRTYSGILIGIDETSNETFTIQESTLLCELKIAKALPIGVMVKPSLKNNVVDRSNDSESVIFYSISGGEVPNTEPKQDLVLTAEKCGDNIYFQKGDNKFALISFQEFGKSEFPVVTSEVKYEVISKYKQMIQHNQNFASN